MIEPKAEVGVRNVEYHQKKTSVPSYLLGYRHRLAVVNVCGVALAPYCVDYIGDHYYRHYGEPVVIEPTHDCIILKP